ncbi:hypothetical protein AWV79_24735 [Cupriavidus sp. UYMMa02A]|nr:hypothetical protein AWV80_01110 [Cupriavidus sp. UYMU48A]ODV42621.1 hypothetical protein AWV79_24735 [Cupriavidus sp. UYMMa02A]
MRDALILAPSGRVWVEPLARCLGDAGLRAQRVTATEAEAVLAGAAPRLVVATPEAVVAPLLQRARSEGALLVCIGAARDDHCDEALAEPVLDEHVFRLLARHQYIAISGAERAGLADAILRQSFGDATFAAELMQALVTATESDLDRLQAGAGSLETLRSVAHRVKASAHLADCEGFRRLAQALETAARGGNAGLADAVAEVFVPTAREFLAMLLDSSRS